MASNAKPIDRGEKCRIHQRTVSTKDVRNRQGVGRDTVHATMPPGSAVNSRRLDTRRVGWKGAGRRWRPGVGARSTMPAISPVRARRRLLRKQPRPEQGKSDAARDKKPAPLDREQIDFRRTVCSYAGFFEPSLTDEKDVSAEQSAAEADARLSRADGQSRRTSDAQAASRQGSEASYGQHPA